MLYLMSQPTMKNVKFIATFRPSLSGPKIISFFDSVQRENAMYTLNIGKLDNKSMLSLLLHYFPDINTDTALGLVELADGNPYWMKTIMSGLDSGYNDFSGKASLIGLFNMSLSALSVQARGIVNALAILGESCAEKLFACICSESRARGAGRDILSALHRQPHLPGL